MRGLRALALGAVASLLVAYVLATGAAVAVAAAGASLSVELGPVLVLAVERLDGDGGTETTLGPGLLLAAIAGGAANAVAALALARRPPRRPR